MSFPCLLPLVAARWPDYLRLTRTQGDAAGAGRECGGGLSFVALSLPPVSHALPVHFRGLMVTGERGEARGAVLRSEDPCPHTAGSLRHGFLFARGRETTSRRSFFQRERKKLTKVEEEIQWAGGSQWERAAGN